MTDALRKIDELSARLEIAEKSSTEPIAVVGMGCRFPGEVNNAEQYWDLLKDGRSGIVRVPPERWDADKYYTDDHTVPGTICNREGGFLRSWQPDEFDAEFFAISPREAAAIDPQQRLLLEVACEALEDAGIPARAIRGTQTGVFVGLTAYDYMLTLSAGIAQEDLDAYILDRELGELRGGTVGVLPRRAGSGHGPRHRMLVVADGDPPGLPEPAQPRKRHRTGRGHQPHAQPGREHRLLALGDAGARRPVQDLRRESRRLRPQRGLRGRGAQAARRCAARRGPRPGGGAGFGGQPGRRQQRGDRPERACPAGATASGTDLGATGAQRHRLCRGTRHRHPARRSDRTRGAGQGVRRPRRLPAAGPRIGQDESGSPGGGGRCCRLHQDRPEPAQRLHPTTPQLRDIDAARHRRGVVPDHRIRRAGMAVDRPSAPRGRFVLRRLRHQRPHCSRAGPGTGCRRGGYATAGIDARGVRQVRGPGHVAGRGARRLDDRTRRAGAVGRYRAHPQPPPHATPQIRDGMCPRPSFGGGRAAGADRR